MKKTKKQRLKPISLHPLTPEEALAAFMKVDPDKVRVAGKQKKKRHKKQEGRSTK